MQVGGLHMHISVEGIGDVHGTHAHQPQTGADGHGHEADSDVSFLESATGWVKPLPFLVLFIAVLFTAMAFVRQAWLPIATAINTDRHFRWRPPLRAPPLSVS